MALAYQWEITAMDAKIQEYGYDNVIYSVHYTYKGFEGKYSGFVMGVMQLKFDPNTPFVPRADDQDFENVVIGWLEAGLDVVEMQLQIQKQVDKEIKPVDETLFFTFNNPPAE